MAQYRFDPAPLNTHQLLLARIPAASKVLEVGTADGYLGEFLTREKKCEVWGVEPFAKFCEQAKGAGYAKLFNNSVEEVLDKNMLGEEKFGVIFLGDVLEHLADPGRILEKLKKHLSPGGRLVISLPNVAYAGVRFGLLFGRWNLTDAGILDRTHLRFFTLDTARALLTAAGYRIVEERPSHGALERFGLNKLKKIGRRILYFWPRLLAVQFIFVCEA